MSAPTEPSQRHRHQKRRGARQPNFTAFDKELQAVGDRHEHLALELTTSEEDSPLICTVELVDQYFIKVRTEGDRLIWVNKSHIVVAEPISNGE